MKTIIEKFNSIQKEQPWWSSWVVFYVTIRHSRFTKSSIINHFYKLVNKDDYSGGMKKHLLAYLEKVCESK